MDGNSEILKIKTMKLKSLSAFVLEQTNEEKGFESRLQICVNTAFNNIVNYTEFLSQPLKMSMFVPTNDEGNILGKPKHFDEWLLQYQKGFVHEYEGLLMIEYFKALEKVLFKGFEVKDYYAQYTGEDEMIYIDEEFCENMTIEKFLTTIVSEIELTESALKQIGIDE